MSIRDTALSCRAWLIADFFRDSGSPGRPTRRRTLAYGGVAAAAVLVQLARMWPSKPLNSIYAEDGYLWLTDAMKRGFVHNLGTPYNGYLQTVSRLVAEPVSLLPISWFAPCMALVGAAIVALCALVVWNASASHLHSPFLRGTLAAMVILLPTVGTESLDNVTNSIWFLLFAAFWVLLWRPSTMYGAAGAALLVFLVALTNGGVVLYLPLWGLRLLAMRDRKDQVIIVGFGVGLALQLAFSWKVMNVLGERGGGQFTFPSQWHWGLVSAYVQRVVGGAITGQSITGYLWAHLGFALVVLFAAGLMALVIGTWFVSPRRTSVLVCLMVGTSLATFLFSGYKRWFSAGFVFLWPKGTSNTAASHYLIVPTLLLLSALVVQVDGVSLPARAKSPRFWQSAFMVFVLAASLVTFKVSNSTRGSHTWTQELQVSKEVCLRTHARTTRVLIAPDSVYAIYMDVPCPKLTGLAPPRP